MTIYTLEIQSRETEDIGYQHLPPGTTEEQAIIAAEAAARESKGWGIYLSFSRSEDGQHGFINPTGAALVGEDWV